MVSKISDARILIVGDVMLDRYIWGDVRRISPEAPVPIVRVQKKEHTPGGAGNVAMNLKGIGCDTTLFSICGDDEPGAILSDLFKKNGIQKTLIPVPGLPTTTKTRIMGRGQQVLRLDEEKVQSLPDALCNDLVNALLLCLKEANGVILSDYGKGVLTGKLPQRIISAASKSNIPVFVDPKGRHWQRYRGATCLKPNWNEFLSYIGVDRIEDASLLSRHALEMIDTLDLSYLLITRGAAGMFLYGKKGLIRHLSAKAREVFDVSGAGDTVAAVLSAAHASGFSILDSAQLANTAAGIVVGKIGTRPILKVELEREVRADEGLRPEKILSLKAAVGRVSQWREEGRKVVFTNGCFDILHIGHVHLLQHASQEGDRLVVGLNSDPSIKRLKGDRRPVMPQWHRATLLASLEFVDMVVIFDGDTPIDTILALKPDVLVKGSDYQGKTIVGQKEVESWGGRTFLVPVLEGVSTTKVIEDLRS